MFGIGGSEAIVLVIVALLLFGGPVLTFLLGYMLGQKKADAHVAHSGPAPAPPATTPTAEQHEETQADD